MITHIEGKVQHSKGGWMLCRTIDNRIIIECKATATAEEAMEIAESIAEIVESIKKKEESK
jgi:hypothetical protein